MKYFLYNGRHGETLLVEHTIEGWDYLIVEMQRDNGSSLNELRDAGFDVAGSFAHGSISVDDGGSIETIEVTQL